MKKANKVKSNDNEMRREYDFRGAVRGKFYKPMHKGYTVRVHKRNGTTVIQHYKIAEGTVMLQPDVRKYFSDSESVNAALRSLIDLMAQMPARSKVLTHKGASHKRTR